MCRRELGSAAARVGLSAAGVGNSRRAAAAAAAAPEAPQRAGDRDRRRVHADFSNVVSPLFADKQSCEAPDADYVVAATRDVNGSCPAGDYRLFIHLSWDYSAQLLCLIPNVTAGECFSTAPNHPGQVPCGLGERRFGIEVVRVANAADAGCGGAVAALRFTVPPSTICYQDFAPGG